LRSKIYIKNHARGTFGAVFAGIDPPIWKKKSIA